MFGKKPNIQKATVTQCHGYKMAAQNGSNQHTTHISLVVPFPEREKGSGETAAENMYRD